MRDAKATKNTIIKESANLFNTQGYKATSISDITRATGFTKGAIYRHFDSKQDLEQHALRRLSKLMFEEMSVSIKQAKTFQAKFEAIFSFFENYMNAPLYEGGCPLMNAAVESDDTNPILRQQAYNMLAQLKASLAKLIKNGIKNKQVRPDVNISYYSTVFIATLEGGIMMSKLERNKKAISHTIDHLRGLVDELSI
ncbi:MAG: TetR/AcrR family transcriptional regulator [Bacteroidia bacterium]|nr:TetR/AcrR family transcriptional regulator [Bacteroidia bacterium]NNF30652.1 TetR/AcrR family transcriptional regulator [Flavobacteriaceae bacterium]MBT8274876.1 TetR/AcrR family transcriptional regulator [Bacteroidia bacterium]NNJ80695.1 TetR/AcrR family transcriptional regulator [Flavobacteriaceae bacterium]NNK54903.1 TetR/AcrR family transcriptional regulator [Flavobacteriaceae bacterium]